MKNGIIYLLTFLAICLPAVWFIFFADDKPKAKRRAKREDFPLLFRLFATPVRLLNSLGIGYFWLRVQSNSIPRLRKKLNYAGVDISPEDVYSCRLLLTVLFFIISGFLTWLLVEEYRVECAFIGAFIGAFVGGSLPGVVIGNRVQERKTKILHALPYSIDLISSAMRGGLDFSAAVLFYVKLGISGPLTDEYSTMLREMRLGVIRTTALLNMAERIKIKEFTSFASAVVMGTELGASLAETMEIQSEEMRKLRFAIAECKAQRAPSLMLLPMALFILPAVFIIILTPVFIKMQEAGVPLF